MEAEEFLEPNHINLGLLDELCTLLTLRGKLEKARMWGVQIT